MEDIVKPFLFFLLLLLAWLIVTVLKEQGTSCFFLMFDEYFSAYDRPSNVLGFFALQILRKNAKIVFQ